MTQEQALETLRLLRKDRETILSLAREHSDRCPPWEKLGMLQLIDAIQDLPLPKAEAVTAEAAHDATRP